MVVLSLTRNLQKPVRTELPVLNLDRPTLRFFLDLHLRGAATTLFNEPNTRCGKV
jgi:hypothetical protein